MRQLLDQIKVAIPIFEYLQPSAIGIWIFDCSSAHEALSEDALNVKNMNIKPGGKQAKLRNTTIPMNNLGPKPGAVDMRGQQQSLVYAADHPDPDLHGKAKGIRAVLKERTSVWDAICEAAGGEKRVKNVCIGCKASQMEKD